MGNRFRDSTSRAPLAYAVDAEVAGEVWYPGVASTVAGAYLRDPFAKPETGDWVDGVFELTTTGAVRALVPCGPTTDNDLAKGTWYEWVKIDDPATGDQPVEQVGKVIVQ